MLRTGLGEGLSGPQNTRIVEFSADDLEARREALGREAAGPGPAGRPVSLPSEPEPLLLQYFFGAAGFFTGALRAVVFRAVVLRAVGFRTVVLRAAVFRAVVLRAAGFRTVILRAAGFRTVVLRAAGFRAVVLRAAGFRTVVLRAAGFRTVVRAVLAVAAIPVSCELCLLGQMVRSLSARPSGNTITCRRPASRAAIALASVLAARRTGTASAGRSSSSSAISTGLDHLSSPAVSSSFLHFLFNDIAQDQKSNGPNTYPNSQPLCMSFL